MIPLLPNKPNSHKFIYHKQNKICTLANNSFGTKEPKTEKDIYIVDSLLIIDKLNCKTNPAKL